MEGQAEIDPKLLEFLVCPLTKAPLRYDRAAQELIRGSGARLPDPRRHSDHARRRGAAPARGRGAKAVAATVSGRPPSNPWPTELRLKRAEKLLEISFDDGRRFSLPAEYLRVESPSAEVQGHGPGQKVVVHGRAHVGIMSLEAVGNYAVRILFDDLHDTGIYSW